MNDKVVNFKNYQRPPHPDKSPAKYIIYAGAGLAIICGLITVYLFYIGNMMGLITFALTLVALWVMRKGQDMKQVAKTKWESGSLH